jgi:hypothetical protein
MTINWSELPALNPDDFTTVESFESLRLSENTLVTKSTSDPDVSLTWKTFCARDGASIPLLYYDSPTCGQKEVRPLLLMFHGGGMVSHRLVSLICRVADLVF